MRLPKRKPSDFARDPYLEKLRKAKPLKWYQPGKKVKSCDGYTYILTEDVGSNYADGFTPYYTPREMLTMGVFEGKYLNDCTGEFPLEWFADAYLAGTIRPSGPPDISANFFKIKSRLPLSDWQAKGWVPGGGVSYKKHPVLSDSNVNPDTRGWFQWYCRYYIGRRIPEIDNAQIARWKSFVRHSGAIKANCEPHDLNCRPRQRQALLQWSWDPMI